MSDLTKDAILALADLGSKAAAPKVFKVDGVLGAYIAKPDNTLELVAPDEPDIRHSLDTPDEVYAFAKDRSDPAKAVIFLGESGMVLVLDCEKGGMRRHKVACKLKPSVAWAALRNPPLPADHKAFIRELRTTFADVIPSEVLSAVRSVKFSTAEDASRADVPGQSAASYSRSDLVVGLDGRGVPEDVTLTLQPFTNFAFSTYVRCILDIDKETRKFRLVALPDSLELAMSETLTAILKLRESGHPPVYFGSP